MWQAAIGLQAVDGLQTSDYLKSTARKHIEGEIDIEEVRDLIKSYYQSKTRRNPDDDGIQEADKVSANIAKILSSQTLDFSAGGYSQLSLKMMMESIGLKGRDNFLNLYLNPAIREGYVCLLYPDSSRHPRQKYLLVVKG